MKSRAFMSVAFLTGLVLIVSSFCTLEAASMKKESEARKAKEKEREAKQKENKKASAAKQAAAKKKRKQNREQMIEKVAERIVQKLSKPGMNVEQIREKMLKRVANRRKKADAAIGGAKVQIKSHVVVFNDDSVLECSLIMKGSKFVVVMTDEGEVEIDPKEIREIKETEDGWSNWAKVYRAPVFAAAELVEGLLYLTPPEPGEEEDEEYEDAANEGAEEGTLIEEPTKTDDTSSKPATAPRPATLRPMPAETMGAPSKATTTMPTGLQSNNVTERLDAIRAMREREEAMNPAAKVKEKKGFSEFLKSLDSKDGVNSILEQLKKNPDFFKDIDLSK